MANAKYAAIRDYSRKFPKKSHRIIASDLKTSKSSVQRALAENGLAADGRTIETDLKSTTGTITTRSLDIRTLDRALEIADVDLNTWEVDRHVINSWEVTMSAKSAASDRPETFTNYQVKVWLKRKTAPVLAAAVLLSEMKANSVKVPFLKKPKRTKDEPRRALEISLMDPHLGLHCFAPAADHAWDMDLCEQMYLGALDDLLSRGCLYGPIEEILFTFGHDYLHADNVWHTTTGGTGQPEADAWMNAFQRGEKLAVAAIDQMQNLAPVTIKVVPGNHARQTEFTMGRLLAAYYHQNENVTVDASASPYKFWQFGVNLIGLEHGHSVKPLRMAALMANETRLKGWKEARYCEWHCGDQHRKGSSKPSMFEEQGVSIEYLPGLTPPNEWHRIKSYNWQKRGAIAFVYDRDAGPICRLQINIDSYTGRFMGAPADEEKA